MESIAPSEIQLIDKFPKSSVDKNEKYDSDIISSDFHFDEHDDDNKDKYKDMEWVHEHDLIESVSLTKKIASIAILFASFGQGI
jgi:hypothetical protein